LAWNRILKIKEIHQSLKDYGPWYTIGGNREDNTDGEMRLSISERRLREQVSARAKSPDENQIILKSSDRSGGGSGSARTQIWRS
jgi:hypothetical protein